MNYSIYRVSLDMHDTSSQVMLNVKQGDSARKIYISLTDGSRPYKISADCTARLRAKTSSGAILFNDCTIKDNVIEYTLTNETCKNVGIVECEVTLYGSDGLKITSARFSLIVEGVITSDNEIESTNEFTALDNALKETNNISVSVSKVNDAATISVTKKDGTTQTATVKDGADGKDGYTPQKGVDYFDGADGKDADITELASAIVGTAKGTTLSITDSANVNLRNLKVYGKSTQDGIPTPDAPIDIVSVGDDGNLKCDVCGKNLIEPLMENSTRNGITVTNNGDGSFTVNGTAEGTAAFRLNQSTMNGLDNLKPYKGKYYLSLRDEAGNKNPQGLMLFLVQASDWKNYLGSATKPTADIDVSGSFVYLHVEDGGTFSNFVIYPQLEVGSSMTSWEEPTINPLEITLNIPLRAIPVTDSSLATYTDASGQMWCADEIDLDRGVYIQRVQKASDFYPSQTGNVCDYYSITMPFNSLGTYIHPYALCTHTNEYKYHTEDVTHFYVDGKGIRVYVPKGTNIEGLTVYAILETPIETPLTAEEIAAYKQLKANYPNTIITNDENAYMSAEYVVDTKTYIEKFVQKAIGVKSSVTLLASAWEGDSNLYSQVVNINGVTANSKVDLNPSVEQLQIFYNKDISFVTENDGGVITVFVIGQKPTNDYTMQVTITEVIVNA